MQKKFSWGMKLCTNTTPYTGYAANHQTPDMNTDVTHTYQEQVHVDRNFSLRVNPDFGLRFL